MRLVQPAFTRDADPHHRGLPTPRQVVRMVLHQRRDHDLAAIEPNAIGQLVDRFCRVLDEHHDIGAWVGAHELGDRLVRLLVGRSAEARLEAGSPRSGTFSSSPTIRSPPPEVVLSRTIHIALTDDISRSRRQLLNGSPTWHQT